LRFCRTESASCVFPDVLSERGCVDEGQGNNSVRAVSCTAIRRCGRFSGRSELKFSEKVAKLRSPRNVISRFVCFQRFTASRVVRTGVGSVGFAAALALRRILCLICLVMFHPTTLASLLLDAPSGLWTLVCHGRLV
jgi:hypothetical protein